MPRLLLPLAIAAVIIVSLAGCADSSPVQDAARSPGPTASSPAPSAPPSPTATATALNIAVTVACSALITDAALKQLFSDFVVDPSYSPLAGSTAATFVTKGGVACGWKNSTGEKLEVTLVAMAADELTTHKNDLVMSSNSVPTYRVEGYFRIASKVGIADAFSGKYWIVTSSAHYAEPGDAAPVVASALDALG